MTKTGKHWFRDSRRAIKRVYGSDWRLFCGLLAATSARSSVKSNLSLAVKAYHHYLTYGEARRDGFLHAHYVNVQTVIETGIPNGRKCKSFYRNLIGDESVVTVDVWMMRYFGYNKVAPNKSEYDLIESAIQQDAVALGITPAQHQAIMWCEIRGDAGGYDTRMAQLRLC